MAKKHHVPHVFKEDMLYNGTVLDWYSQGQFKATSGLVGYQNASFQTTVDHGPIPEGLYSFPLHVAKDATMVSPSGDLDQREGVEHIPDTITGFGKTYSFPGWGPDRVRLSTIHIKDVKARHRGGFYLHDSHKGYSHGCIEVAAMFFGKLRLYINLPANKRAGKTRLYLKVQYPSPTADTNGGTKY
jgi:hypothetical protein